MVLMKLIIKKSVGIEYPINFMYPYPTFYADHPPTLLTQS